MRVIKIICKILFERTYPLCWNHIIGISLIAIGFIFLLYCVCSPDIEVNGDSLFSPVICIVAGLIVLRFKNLIHL